MSMPVTSARPARRTNATTCSSPASRVRSSFPRRPGNDSPTKPSATLERRRAPGAPSTPGLIEQGPIRSPGPRAPSGNLAPGSAAPLYEIPHKLDVLLRHGAKYLAKLRTTHSMQSGGLETAAPYADEYAGLPSHYLFGPISIRGVVQTFSPDPGVVASSPKRRQEIPAGRAATRGASRPSRPALRGSP